MTDSFEENSHYRLSIEIGDGAYGKCFLAVEIPADNTVEGKVFCVKKVRTSCCFVQVSITSPDIYFREETIMVLIW